MKKVLIILVCIVASLGLMAQQYSYVPTADTLSDGETVYVTLDQSVPFDYAAGFSVTLDTISGTATVTGVLQ